MYFLLLLHYLTGMNHTFEPNKHLKKSLFYARVKVVTLVTLATVVTVVTVVTVMTVVTVVTLVTVVTVVQVKFFE